VQKETGRWKSRRKIRDLADGRYSRAVLDFLFSTNVRRLVPAEEYARSEVSEWEREEEREAEAEAPGAKGEPSDGAEPPLFLPIPSFMASADEE